MTSNFSLLIALTLSCTRPQAERLPTISDASARGVFNIPCWLYHSYGNDAQSVWNRYPNQLPMRTGMSFLQRMTPWSTVLFAELGSTLSAISVCREEDNIPHMTIPNLKSTQVPWSTSAFWYDYGRHRSRNQMCFRWWIASLQCHLQMCVVLHLGTLVPHECI